LLKAKQKAFLAAYVLTASITKAADAGKCDRQQHYRWLKESGAYAAAFSESKDEAAQSLEDEAVRRAHEGILEPVFYKGKPAGVIRVFSDALMLALLKAFRPDRYRDRVSAEVSGPDGGPIALANEALMGLTDEELEALVVLAAKLKPK